MKIVYIRRSLALGDTLLAQPLVYHFLKMGCRVIFISSYAHILNSKSKLTLKTNFNWWDRLVFLFRKLLYGSKIRWIELDGAYESQPDISISEAYQRTAGVSAVLPPVDESSFKQNTKVNTPEKPYILFHLQAPSTILNYRNIHGVDWKEVETALKKEGFNCVELLSEQHGYRPILTEFIHHDFMDLTALMSKAYAFIGLDSAPMHIAGMFKIPSFVFFGSVNPDLRLDKRTFTGMIFQNSCEFSGCYHSVIGTRGATCRLVGDSGDPPCCTFETEEVIRSILSKLQ